MKKKPYINSREFCVAVLSNLTECCDPHCNKRKLLEVFKWLNLILTVQLSPQLANKQIGEKPPVMTQKDLNMETPKEFDDVVSDILLFNLQCLSNEDEEVRCVRSLELGRTRDQLPAADRHPRGGPNREEQRGLHNLP